MPRRGTEFIPVNRAQALSLLRALDDDVTRLSPLQVVALRELYFLDDPRSVEVRVKAARVIPCPS